MKRVMLSVVLALVPLTVFAQQIDYDERRAASLRRCDQPLHRGQVADARACFQALLRSSREPLIQAESAWAMGDLRAANELFRQAVAAEPRAVLPRVRWGRMFLDAGQITDALRLFDKALGIDANDGGAQLSMARATTERFDADVSDTITKLLAANDNLIEAHLIASRVAIESGQLDVAVRSAQRALTLTQQQGQPPLEAQTLLAAIEVIRNREPR